MSLLVVILGCLYAAAATFGLCFAANVVASRLRLVDHPSGRKCHASPTPLIGGLVMLVAILPPTAAICWLSGTVIPANNFVLLFAVTTLTLLGLADDREDHSPTIRLAIATLVFAAVAASDSVLRIDQIAFAAPKITFVIDRRWLAVIFSTVCYVGLVNAINMADGKNGLVPGLNCVWLVYLFYLAPEIYAPLTLAPLAALLALLPFNLKGRVFLGDGGSYGFATLTAFLTAAIYNYHGPEKAHAITADQIWLLFLIPVIDPFRLVFSRVQNGKTPMTPGRDHFHHHLQNWLGWPAGLLVYWGLVILPAALNIFVGVNSVVLLVLTLLAYGFLLSKGSLAAEAVPVPAADLRN
jgi:UDP-GlcNAc:undecaprenyl-phosphate GlcNAc-1-phosphate transferase